MLRPVIETPRAPVLLFDLGGVLIVNTGFQALEDLLPYKIDRAALKERWLSSSAVRGFELGQLAPEAFAIDFLEEWRINLSPVEFSSQFISWAKGLFPGTETVACELDAKLTRIYFFDDSLPNVIAAQSLGMRGFQVEGIDDVERALKNANLL